MNYALANELLTLGAQVAINELQQALNQANQRIKELEEKLKKTEKPKPAE